MFGRGEKRATSANRATGAQRQASASRSPAYLRRHPDQASADMMSYYHRGTTLTGLNQHRDVAEERKKLRRLRALRRRMVGLALALLIIVGLGAALLLQYTGSISGVALANLAGKDATLTDSDSERYSKIMTDYLAQNSFERFSFARRSTALLQYFERQAPEVSAVSITPSGLARGRLNVTVRQPVAMWVSGNKTSFVDSKGVVFERNYFAAPSLAIEDDSGVELSGKMATSSSFLSFVGRVATELKKQNLVIQRVVIPRGSARYVEIYLADRAYPFKAQITRGATSQASDIAVMARYVDSHGLSPQYIDCRVEGKAYWK